MKTEFFIKPLEKTKTIPKRFKLEIKKGKLSTKVTLEEWQMRELIGKLDNAI